MIDVKPTVTGVMFRLHAKPRSSRSALVGEHNRALSVAVTAAPVDGKANAAIIKLLAKAFGVAKSAVEIVGGQSGREKRVAIDGISVKQAKDILAALE